MSKYDNNTKGSVFFALLLVDECSVWAPLDLGAAFDTVDQSM